MLKLEEMHHNNKLMQEKVMKHNDITHITLRHSTAISVPYIKK